MVEEIGCVFGSNFQVPQDRRWNAEMIGSVRKRASGHKMNLSKGEMTVTVVSKLEIDC